MEQSYRSNRWQVISKSIGLGLWETEVRQPLPNGFVVERHRWKSQWRKTLDLWVERIGLAFGWLALVGTGIMAIGGVALMSVGFGLLTGALR